MIINILMLLALSLILPANEATSSPKISSTDSDTCEIETYFTNFEFLAKTEQWEHILAQGSAALDLCKKSHRYTDEAKICAQLTSTSFYMGNYTQALIYASRCHELAEQFEDPSLFLRALYLESAIYRALAAKELTEETQQEFYAQAVKISEKAAALYLEKEISNIDLKGKIYFNHGAALADNPKGDLDQAKNCYSIALECFKESQSIDDTIRTSIRLGKVYLLQNNYKLCRDMLDQIRPLLSNQRLSMHADYLEAQLQFTTNNPEEALKIAEIGLRKAQILGAKEDEARLRALMEKIRKSTACSK